MKANTKNSVRKSITAVLFATIMVTSVFFAVIPEAAAQIIPPEVICVAWKGDENLPHPTWDGKEVTLKGTGRYDGDIEYTWDFGDGTSVETGTATTTGEYPFPISTEHTYTGLDGTMYVATLTVTAGGETKSDTYLVQILPQTLEVEADVAIDEGLWSLYQDQNRYTSDDIECGYWGEWSRVGHTGAAVQAFENNMHKPFGDPTKDPYVDCVRRGLNFLLSMAYPVDIPSEDPYGGDTNGNGFGIACNDNSEMYEVGIAMMAIVSSDTPGREAVTGPEDVIGRTYQEIIQDMADYCAWAQNDPIPDVTQGIYMFNLTTDTQSLISAGCKDSPAISGDKIAWMDEIEENIYVYDLITGRETFIGGGRNPAISGDRIVWMDNRNDNWDIYMYDLGTGEETPICTDPADQYWPAILGDRIVWMDNRNDNWDIYMYDLGTGTETPICIDPADQARPAISGDRIVWTDNRNDNWDIYMYDLGTGTETLIYIDPADQVYPAISGDKIVWMDMRHDNWDIYMYDLGTGTEIPICIDPADQRHPAISGDKIVWMDMRHDNWDIYMYNLTTSTETQICIDPFNQEYSDISGDNIVWSIYYGDPNRVGGWRYNPNHKTSDNSVTQWPIIGMEPAEAKWGIEIADFVKPRLEDWLNYSQCKEPDWRYGGFGYKDPCDWVNIAKTAGTGIPGLLFCDVPMADERVQGAIDFIDDRWDEDDEHWGSYYAMYGVMKAFCVEFSNMESTGSHIWWDEYARNLVDIQNVDGSWPEGQWSEHPLSTAWAILILTGLYDIPPTAIAMANGLDETEVDKDQIIYLDGCESRDGTYHIVKYEWDWESDGIYDFSSSECIAEHAYPDYVAEPTVVTLKVTDDRDIVTGGEKPAMSDTDTCIVSVHPPPHPPIADADGPYIGWIGFPVTLDGSGSWDPNEPPFGKDEIISWDWDLDNDGEFDDASGEMITYTWDNLGIYPIALRVTVREEPKLSEPSRTIVEIGNHEPVAYANGPYETRPCTPVTLSGCGSYEPDEPIGDYIVSYEWDLDNDGEYDDAIGHLVEFHRDVEGVCVVRLKVTDTYGATGTDWTTVNVTPVEIPVPTLTPIGLVALIGLLSIIAISKIWRRDN